MKTMKLFTYFFLALSLTLIGCTGEDGTDGMDGEQGPQGEIGNANVISVIVNEYDVVIGQNEILVPELTQDIYDNGLVFGYSTVNGNQFWETLPIIVSQNVRLDIDRIEVGEIILTADFEQTLDFRFILIQGIEATSFSSISSFNTENIDFTDYEAVKEAYNLKD